MTTGDLILRVMFMVALPIAVFSGGVLLMKKVSLYQKVEEQAGTAPNSCDRKPLDQRRLGYDAGAVDRYWGALNKDARAAEQHFLEVDLVFPFLYGGALAACLLLAWITLGRPFSPAWIMAPVALTMLADWTENLVQLAQLRRYCSAQPLQAGWIRVASAATSLKLLFFTASSLFLLTLVVIVLICAARNPAPGQP